MSKTVLIGIAVSISAGIITGAWFWFQNQVVTVQVVPRPYIQRHNGFEAEVLSEEDGQIGIFVGDAYNCKRTTTSMIGGPSIQAGDFENPEVFGCKELPSSFFDQSQLWEWINTFGLEDANDNYFTQYESAAAPLLFLTIKSEKIESCLSVSTFRKIRKYNNVNWYEVNWPNSGPKWFKFTRYDIDPAVQLFKCNFENRDFHGVSTAENQGEVSCGKLVVENKYPYYLVSTNEWPLHIATRELENYFGHETDHIPWLIVENPFFEAE